MRKQKKLPVLALAAALLLTAAVPEAGAVGEGTLQVNLVADQPEVSINGEVQSWDVVPAAAGDQVYVPIRHFGDTVGFQVQWNAKIGMVEMVIPGVKVQFDIDHNEAWINQIKVPLDTVIPSIL